MRSVGEMTVVMKEEFLVLLGGPLRNHDDWLIGYDLCFHVRLDLDCRW